ncbi:MAG: UDP-3-O-(3-hydroxymyristoyl)glucosamine N-acyltransferase [Steroidobacteraceae bacterium]
MPAGAASCTLGALAVRFGCQLRGDPDVAVSAVGTLEGGASQLGFVASAAYRHALRATRLAAVIVTPGLVADCPTAALVHSNPHATFARIAAVLHPPAPVAPGVHATALVHPSAQIDASAEIGAFCVIAAGAVIGPRCRIGPHGVLGAGASLGADTWLRERVTVCAGSVIGARCVLHPGAVIGSDGFGNARDNGQWVTVPQVGGVRLGDDVAIGANTTIDRGALGDTVIEEGARLDNQIQIAHNVIVGAHTAIAACTGIAGSTRIGRRCMIGGGTGIGGQLVIGDDIVITGFGMVTHSLDKPGMYSSVLPVEEARLWRRLVGRFKRLDQLAIRVRKLESASSIAATGQDDDN